MNWLDQTLTPEKASYYECVEFMSHFEPSAHRDLYWQPEELTRSTTQQEVYNSNKLTNQMQQFYKFITWRFVSLNMFGAPPRLHNRPDHD